MSKAYDVLMVEVGNMSKRQTTAVFDYVDQLRAELASEREAGLRCFEDKVKLEADRDQISLTLDVAKADRDKWFNRARDLEAALRGLYDDNVDYQRLNNLGGYDNHWLVAARKALGITAETFDDGVPK